MKISDNPTKYEVLSEQYLRSILDISAEQAIDHFRILGIRASWRWNKRRDKNYLHLKRLFALASVAS